MNVNRGSDFISDEDLLSNMDRLSKLLPQGDDGMHDHLTYELQN